MQMTMCGRHSRKIVKCICLSSCEYVSVNETDREKERWIERERQRKGKDEEREDKRKREKIRNVWHCKRESVFKMLAFFFNFFFFLQKVMSKSTFSEMDGVSNNLWDVLSNRISHCLSTCSKEKSQVTYCLITIAFHWSHINLLLLH